MKNETNKNQKLEKVNILKEKIDVILNSLVCFGDDYSDDSFKSDLNKLKTKIDELAR